MPLTSDQIRALFADLQKVDEVGADPVQEGLIGRIITADDMHRIAANFFVPPEFAVLVGKADAQNPGRTGVYGYSKDGYGVFGKSDNGYGGYFKGKLGIVGKFVCKGDMVGNQGHFDDVSITGADCAEEFDVSGDNAAEPGQVMTLNDDGSLTPCQRAYDTRVAGVVSGAGSYKPAIVMDRTPTGRNRKPIALLGKVFCKADATFGRISIGDLLTTSPVIGHAMRASDQSRSFGAVIGKALRSLEAGQGLIPVLIALQ